MKPTITKTHTTHPITLTQLIPFVITNGVIHLALVVPAVTAQPALLILGTLLGWVLVVLELLILVLIGIRHARCHLVTLPGRLRQWRSCHLTIFAPSDPCVETQEVQALWQRVCQVSQEVHLLTPLLAAARQVVAQPEATTTQTSLRADVQALRRFLEQVGFPAVSQSAAPARIDLRAVRLHQRDARFLQQWVATLEQSLSTIHQQIMQAVVSTVVQQQQRVEREHPSAQSDAACQRVQAALTTLHQASQNPSCPPLLVVQQAQALAKDLNALHARLGQRRSRRMPTDPRSYIVPCSCRPVALFFSLCACLPSQRLAVTRGLCAGDIPTQITAPATLTDGRNPERTPPMTLILATLTTAHKSFSTTLIDAQDRDLSRDELEARYEDLIDHLDRDTATLLRLASTGREEDLPAPLCTLLAVWAEKEAITLLLRHPQTWFDPIDPNVQQPFRRALRGQHQHLSAELRLRLQQHEEQARRAEQQASEWRAVAFDALESQQEATWQWGQQQRQMLDHTWQASQRSSQREQELNGLAQQANQQWATVALTGVQQAQLGMQQYYQLAASTQASVAKMLEGSTKAQDDLVHQVERTNKKHSGGCLKTVAVTVLATLLIFLLTYGLAFLAASHLFSVK